jgi:hypothetical protein
MMQERLDSDLSLEAPIEKNMSEIIQLNGEVGNPASVYTMIGRLNNEEQMVFAFSIRIHAL